MTDSDDTRQGATVRRERDVLDADMLMWRRQQNRELLTRPLWWMYWKARHKTWRQRAAIRRGVRLAVDVPLIYWELYRSPIE